MAVLKELMEAAGMSFTLYYEGALTVEAVNKELLTTTITIIDHQGNRV